MILHISWKLTRGQEKEKRRTKNKGASLKIASQPVG